MQRITAEMPPTRSSSATDGWRNDAASAGAPRKLFVPPISEGQWPSFFAAGRWPTWEPTALARRQREGPSETGANPVG